MPRRLRMPTFTNLSGPTEEENVDDGDGEPETPTATEQKEEENGSSPAKTASPSDSVQVNFSQSPVAASPRVRKTARKSPARGTPSPSSKARQHQQPQPRPPAPVSVNPSPFQVLCDSLDANSHEILQLRGEGPGSVAPYASYKVLTLRLEFYLDQLEDARDALAGPDEVEGAADDGQIIRDPNVRRRMFMARLVTGVCARRAYADDPSGGGKVPAALVDMSAAQLSGHREDLGRIQEKMRSIVGDDGMDSQFESLVSQMEAFEALAKLRAQLRAAIEDIDEGGDGEKRPVSQDDLEEHKSAVEVVLEEYKSTTEVIDGKLQNIHQTSYSDLFVPNQMLSLKRCSNLERVKSSVNNIINGIEGMITKKVFPLQAFQVQFLKHLRGLEQCLPSPTHYQSGYFKGSESSAAATSRSSAAGTSASARALASATSASPVGAARGRGRPRKAAQVPSSPARDEFEFPDSDDESPPKNRDKGRKKKAKRSPKRLRDSDSDSSWGKKPKKARKGRRVPFTEEEKEALIEGLWEFGSNSRKWSKIQEHYKDVFEANCRTNVNLKDLYRTMKKDDEKRLEEGLPRLISEELMQKVDGEGKKKG